MSKKSSVLDFERLMLIAEGHAAFQLLWAGVELGVFDLLSEQPGLTLPQVACERSLQPQPARILLTGLTALLLIKKENNRYLNAELTEKLLVRNKPKSFVPVLGWQRYIVYEGLIDFVESLKENRNKGLERIAGKGKTLYERLTSNKFLENIFQESMSALSQQANNFLLDNLNLVETSHIADIGGGDATNVIALVKKFDHLKATVFDSPSVCEIAQKNVTGAGLESRINTWPGDFLQDPFPKEIDAVLYCHILTIWSPANNLRLLKKTYDALPEKGKVIIFNMMGNDDDTGPISTALGSPYFQAIATGEGMLYSANDYETWLKQAGFRKIDRINNLTFDHGLLVANK